MKKPMIKVISSPNIAFIKYWGKRPFTHDRERNIGSNPSLSMTLSNAQSKVICALSDSNEDLWQINHQEVSPKDHKKISEHVNRICQEFSLTRKALYINSSNNFPTGTGIASSASSYSALTLAISAVLMGRDAFEVSYSKEQMKYINLARRGSGSACRSLQGPFVFWDEEETQVIQSNWVLYDTILIFSSQEKSISSTEGHQHASSSPLFPSRLEKIPERLKNVKSALHKKSLEQLGPLLEEEADEMHQIMRSGSPSIEYQNEASKSFLKRLKELKNRDFYYTLDAGPNVHLISEKPITLEIKNILKSLDLSPEIWEDKMGTGPHWEYTNER